jgi:hypothetical protein
MYDPDTATLAIDFLAQAVAFNCDFAQAELGLSDSQIRRVLADLAEWYGGPVVPISLPADRLRHVPAAPAP